jgi:pyrimidine operon attenuation protein/uracil phosphoribosyltransferase
LPVDLGYRELPIQTNSIGNFVETRRSESVKDIIE